MQERLELKGVDEVISIFRAGEDREQQNSPTAVVDLEAESDSSNDFEDLPAFNQPRTVALPNSLIYAVVKLRCYYI